jgi:glycine oxidase
LDGIVHAGFGETHLARLRQRAAAIRQGGIECQVLDRTQTLAAEPWLGAHVSGGMFVAAEGYIDNRLLGRALVAACRQLGVAIASVGSLAVECDARRVLGVHTDMGYAPAGAVVNAAGAWAAAVPGIPASSRPPVVPRKGQMLALETPIGFVRHATWVPNGYLVPRDDGRLLVGATDEQAGFDLRTTAGGIAALLDAALTAAPALAGFTVSETWAGLRPGSGDGRPFIGPAPLDGLFVATGHYRNGILLAPITARLVAECVDGRIAGALAAFSLVRAAAEMETPLRGKNEAI